MDTKSKNIKYRSGTKLVAVIILWLSLLVGFSSGVFLLVNSDTIGVENYQETHDTRMIISRLAHNTVELGTKFKHGKNKGSDPSRYKTIEDNLSHVMNYNYYMEDLLTGEKSYKVSEAYSPETLKDAPGAIHIRIDDGSLKASKNDQAYFFIYNTHDIETMITSAPQDLYIVLNNPPVQGDEFYDIYTQFNRAKEWIPYALGGLGGSIILILISFGYLLIVSGRKEKGGDIFLADIDKVYNDVQSVFVAGAAMISIIFVSTFSYNVNNLNNLNIMVIITVFAIDAIIGMTYFFSMLRQLKKGVLVKNTLLYKAFSRASQVVKSLFDEKIFKVWIVGALLIYGFINGMLFRMNYYRGGFLPMLFILVFNLVVAYSLLIRLKSLTIIMEAAKEISNGNLDYQIDQSEISVEFDNFAKDIQSIQGGLRGAVNEAIKGERMKTDLITNVSHDLKTPLTSIINYVDLLKQEEIDNKTARGYLEILDEKSYRLKQLIEDLIEASKASSGNIIITKEEVDLHELVIQACGEYQEKIEEAGLDMRINAPEEKTIILADGKYMWRIIENIMSNALKYSMTNSRIYIDIENKEGYGVLTMKNMSAYPLDIDPSQLTERFTRADESRTTEGSGLGLSIAQSLTSIQDGKFAIEIDGDLFKVIVAMPVGEAASY